MSPRGPLSVLCLAATAGLLFASVSTLDFVAHLDRQVHDLHCSFVPGMPAASDGAEGCKLTLMSPYSSVFRRAQWGGIPITLPAMGVFAFLLFRAVDLWGRPVGERRHAANVLVVATLVPALASVVMGFIAFSKLDAACKLCIGIYGSSALALGAAVWARLRVGDDMPVDPQAQPPGPAGSAGLTWMLGAAQLGGFVAAPAVAYLAMVPDFSSYIGTCGSMDAIDDPYGVLVPLDDHAAGTPTVEVLDPLCPSCKAFEERLGASGLADRLHRVALLFPLDQTCNWMVSKSLHPGACAVSEAVLCARRQGLAVQEVIDWAFMHQAEIMAAEKASPGAAAQQVGERFAALKGCLGSAEVQSDLNKSLRWAVTHELPVMTPQLYVGGTKLCDEDTDLGMEWALSQVLARQADGSLPTAKLTTSAAPPTAVNGARTREAPAGEPAPRAEARPSARPAPAARAKAEPAVQPGPAARPEPEPAAKPEPEPAAKPEPEPAAKPTPAADPTDPPRAGAGKLPSIGEVPPPAEAPEEQGA